MKKDNFEWYTEADEWGAEPQIFSQEPLRQRPKWLIYLLFALVSVLILAVGFVFWRLGQRARENTDAVRESVLDVHQLVRRVTNAEDVDVFQTLATSKNRNWKETQLQLLYQGVYLSRASMGLWLDTTVSPINTPAETQVFLSPDLQTAEVIEPLPYVVDFGEGVESRLLLERTFTYKRDVSEGNWELAPPDDDDAYWGDWLREEGEFVRLVFPSRDEEISRRIASELDAVAGEICTDSLVHCPNEVVLQLKLDRESRSLLALRFNFPRLLRSSFDDSLYNLDLPAPSLVGLPIDETGFQVLFQGYGGWMAAAIINTFTEQLNIPFDFLSQKLSQVGLHPPPNPDYQPSLGAALPPIPFPEQDIQLLCIDGLDGSMNGHLMRYDLLNGNWYDETPKELLSLKFSSQSLLPLLDDSGVILSTRKVEAGTISSQLSLWRNGGLEQLIESEREIYLLPFFSPKISVDEQYIPIMILGEENESDPEFNNLWLLDINSCDSKDCDLEQFGGVPVWSPDRSFGLIVPIFPGDEVSLALYQRETKSFRQIGLGMGQSPFWIDEDTFGYMRFFYADGDPMPEKIDVVVSNLESSGLRTSDTSDLIEPKVVLDTEMVLQALPDHKRPELIFIIDVVASPRQPGLLFFKAIPVENNEVGDEIHLFSYLYPEGSVSYLRSLPMQEAGYALSITRNGRYLTMIGQENVDSPGAGSVSDNLLLVYDIEKDIINEFVINSNPGMGLSSHDWSANEEWLVIAEEGMLRLAAPGFDYEKQILLSLSGCSSAVWVNQR